MGERSARATRQPAKDGLKTAYAIGRASEFVLTLTPTHPMGARLETPERRSVVDFGGRSTRNTRSREARSYGPPPVKGTTRALSRDELRFEIAVGNFIRSCIDLRANEAAFQAWYANAVIAEFGLARVYRETHLARSHLAEIAPNSILSPNLKQGGNEFFPDLSVARLPAIDARNTAARDGSVRHAGEMLGQFSIVTEFKATGSTIKPTPPRAIRTDLFKLAVFAEAHGAANPDAPGPLATYMIILDNFEKRERRRPHYGPERIARVLQDVEADWPKDVHRPTVIVGARTDDNIKISTYRDLEVAVAMP